MSLQSKLTEEKQAGFGSKSNLRRGGPGSRSKSPSGRKSPWIPPPAKATHGFGAPPQKLSWQVMNTNDCNVRCLSFPLLQTFGGDKRALYLWIHRNQGTQVHSGITKMVEFSTGSFMHTKFNRLFFCIYLQICFVRIFPHSSE